MVSLKTIANFCQCAGVKRIINTSKQEIHGINPTVTYPVSGKTFELPRFYSVEMQQAGAMNKIAKTGKYEYYSNNIGPKALPEDRKRLTSTDIEDSYKRAVWVNPKDDKAYHLLEENRTKEGNVLVRILNQDGEFVKNAELKPKKVILADLDVGQEAFGKKIGDVFFSHTDFINILAKRYNPFANYKVWLINNENFENKFEKLYKMVDKNTAAVSISYGSSFSCPASQKHSGKDLKKLLMEHLAYKDIDKKDKMVSYYCSDEKTAIDEVNVYTKAYEKLKNKVRIVKSSGNEGQDAIDASFSSSILEGVGGLDSSGKVEESSASRNSIFTQHYERYSHPVVVNNDGINISGLSGVDYPAPTEPNPFNSYGSVSGTSFASPIRAAKIALNEMMEGIL